MALLLCAAAGWAQSAEGLYEAGRKAFQDGLYPMASRSFQSLVEQYPDSALADDADYLRGLADFYAGEYRRSLAVLSGLERKYPRSANLRRVAYWLGAANYHLGDDRAALGHLDRQISAFPDEPFYADHSLLLRAFAKPAHEELAARCMGFAASALALTCTSAIAVAAGAFLARTVSPMTIRWISGLLFIGAGALRDGTVGMLRNLATKTLTVSDQRVFAKDERLLPDAGQ